MPKPSRREKLLTAGLQVVFEALMLFSPFQPWNGLSALLQNTVG